MLQKFATIKDFYLFLKERKLWWLIPMFTVFIIFAILVIFIGSSPLAPIIYPLF